MDPRIASIGVLALSACSVEPAEYDYGMHLSQVDFHLYAEDMGVYPSDSVLFDPANPFAQTGVGEETKWEVFEAGHWPAAFYAWATVLASGPYGEAQFYTAVAAQGIYDRQDCESKDLFYVRQIAIGGYQQVLDEFPDAVTYDATGTTAFPLGVPAYQGIVSLGGVPDGWILVEGEDGATVVPVASAPDEEG